MIEEPMETGDETPIETENSAVTPTEETPIETGDDSKNTDEQEQGQVLPSENIDYKKELEKRKRTPLEKAIYSRKKIDEQIKKLGGESEENEDREGTPDIQHLLEANNQKLLREINKKSNEDKVRSMARNEDEAELVIWLLNNEEVRPSGDINRDIRRAFLIANEDRYSKEMDEVKRSIQVKELTTKGTGAGQKPVVNSQAPKLSEKDMKMVRSYGLIWDSKINRWIKPKQNDPFVAPRVL